MKYLMILVIVLLLVVAATLIRKAVPVDADGGIHNFSTTSVTANCAGCHRTHTAVGANLLKTTNAWDLCTSCHGVGSNLDVIDGLHNTGSPPTAAGSLRGGGFVNASMAISYTTLVTGPSTSAHQVIGMPGYNGGIINTVWGIGPLGTPNAGLANYSLQCGTCHDPHGKAGPNRTPTYRILRCDFSQDPELSNAGVVDGNCVPDTTDHTYTISNPDGKYYGQMYSSSDTGSDNARMTAMSAWCSSCHTRIHTSDNPNGGPGGPGMTSSGDSFFTYRHPTTGTSVEYNFGTAVTFPKGAPACLTCHVSHGSNALLTTNSAKQVPWPGTPEGGGQYQDSALLRLSQRGVCQACHNK